MTQPSQAQIQTWLDQARQARHDLITGTAVVSMSQQGRSMSFNATQAGIAQLDAYIASLEALLCPSKRAAGRLFTVTQSTDGYGDGCR